MKVFIPVLVLFGSMLFGGCATVTKSSLDGRREEEADARRQVLLADERRVEALRGGDVASMRQLYADDYTLVTEDGVVHTKSDQLNAIASGLLRYDKFDVVERTLRVYGDVVVLVSREQSVIQRAGRLVGGDLRSTRVYKKFGTEWRVITTHASTIAQ